MNSARTIAAMKAGHTLHGGVFGFWTISPMDSRCHNVNCHSSRALMRRKQIVRKGKTNEWVLSLQ